ncbi:HipA domain-containing protein [bacterium]|jgi:serine/threonine-protein kinase HipA|nr:HipA domain-containing protein [bacterium]MBU1434386.1 HipA domain-containing protein [bacterium]MBU1501964.1 HipA domain-containing protein [bacterium]
MQQVRIYLFKKHIADMYQDGDRVYLKQIDDLCHKASPISMNKDLKEIETTHLVFLEKVAGFISDSLPGSFGNEILKNFFLQNNKKYPTVSDKLLFIGNRGLGALAFEPSQEPDTNAEEILELKEMFEKAKELKNNGDYHSLHSAFLVSAHSFVGGARSKAVAAINLESQIVYLGDRKRTLDDGFVHAIIKYDDTAEDDEIRSTYSKIEYIYYLLARKSGIEMMDCYLLEANNKHHFVTKRFDRDEGGKKYHVHSLAGLLHIDYNIPRTIGYEDLLRTAVKLGATQSLNQLFLQMLFNYMFVNQDDHSRNFSFMCDESFKYRATPAYDLTFAKGEKQTSEHQLSLYGKALSQIGLKDITELATEFSISLEFIAASLESMKNLRDEELPKLLKEHSVSAIKQKQLLSEVNQRDLQGALHEQ